MDLVADEEVEEPPHPVLDVVGQRVAAGAAVVRLPERGAAVVADAPLPGEVSQGERHALPVHDVLAADRTAGDAERVARLLVPDQPAVGYGPPLIDGGLPAVGELRLLPAHDREERGRAGEEAEAFEAGDGADDGGACAGDRLLHLALPLGNEVRRAEDEDPPEARRMGCARCDERLAGAHLADDGRALVGLEGEGRAAYGVRLRAER